MDARWRLCSLSADADNQIIGYIIRMLASILRYQTKKSNTLLVYANMAHTSKKFIEIIGNVWDIMNTLLHKKIILPLEYLS